MNLSQKNIVSFQKVSKFYGANHANDNLDMDIAQGSIHAVIGENGAGKSTAMKMLYGMEVPTSGEIFVRGKAVSYHSSKQAVLDGIGMVHQHFMLSAVHSALDNILLSVVDAKSKWKFLPKLLRPFDKNSIQAELEVIAKKMGFKIPWDRPVELLPVGVQQQIEIIKLLYSNVEIMIFDEPTAVLSPDETEKFMEMLRTLKLAGKTSIIITHKLAEVKAIADSVTIMRRGRTVLTAPASQFSIPELAAHMVGREVELSAKPLKPIEQKSTVLKLSGVNLFKSKRQVLKDINFELKSGEILGVAGVQGNGQSPLMHLLYGPSLFKSGSSRWSGSIEFMGQSAKNWTAFEMRSNGAGIVVADRHVKGVLLDETMLENFILGSGKAFVKFGFILRGLAQKACKSVMDRFDVRPDDPLSLMRSYSGGNQQKFVMAKELAKSPKVFFCSEPTRGVDVGSIEQIHGEILKAREGGMGILLVSSQLDELMKLSDRIVVMFEGAITAEFKRSEAEFDEKKIGLFMCGGHS